MARNQQCLLEKRIRLGATQPHKQICCLPLSPRSVLKSKLGSQPRKFTQLWKTGQLANNAPLAGEPVFQVPHCVKTPPIPLQTRKLEPVFNLLPAGKGQPWIYQPATGGKSSLRTGCDSRQPKANRELCIHTVIGKCISWKAFHYSFPTGWS